MTTLQLAVMRGDWWFYGQGVLVVDGEEKDRSTADVAGSKLSGRYGPLWPDGESRDDSEAMQMRSDISSLSSLLRLTILP